jgi:hypothetical protein
MIKRIVAVTVAAGALAVPAVSGAQTSDPAAQCRQAGLDPAVRTESLAFAACVQALGAQSGDLGAQCRQMGFDPAVQPLRFAACVQGLATVQ